MCRGRLRVENRVGEMQARGGVGWGGVVTFFAGRIATMLKMLLLSPENVCPTELTLPRSNPNLAKAVRPS